jgi:hypothetical protein
MFDFLKAKFPRQQLTSAQYEVLNYIDNKCVEMYDGPEADTSTEVFHLVVPVTQQFLPTYVLHRNILKQLSNFSGGYIPRGVAFVQVDLDWHYFIGLYNSNPVDTAKQVMYSDMLTRSNAARSEHEVE